MSPLNNYFAHGAKGIVNIAVKLRVSGLLGDLHHGNKESIRKEKGSGPEKGGCQKGSGSEEEGCQEKEVKGGYTLAAGGSDQAGTLYVAPMDGVWRTRCPRLFLSPSSNPLNRQGRQEPKERVRIDSVATSPTM